MKVISITSLSSWIHCPRQFFMQSVLGIKGPPNSAMILGLIKHKFHELSSAKEEAIVLSLTQSSNANEEYQREYVQLLQKSVQTYLSMLRTVNILPTEAYQKAAAMITSEAIERAALVQPLLAKGIIKEEAWHALQPKIKSEYPIQSKKLALKGRKDKLECYPDKIIPIELKSGSTPQAGVYETHRIQAGSYALLLQESFGTSVQEAIVHYVDTNTKRTVTLNPFLAEWIVETASSVRNCIETRELPKICGKDGCTACKITSNQEYVKRALANLE